MIAQATVAGSVTTVLTCPSGQNIRVESITFANVSGASAESLYVYVVRHGSSAGNSNAIVFAQGVPASRTLIWDTPLMLDAGDKVQALGLLTGNVVTATASYEVLDA